ncbi:cilium assembly protein DZIP1L isoform X2 [Latimeria chalumnae]|uniref:cilium assembly protein DZIP1L isoform X2 n=1 Tax=Latimeria chalumnae TaxID=7897 RepID=UPI00313C0FDA
MPGQIPSHGPFSMNGALLGSTPLSASSLPVFKFRSRHDMVDWRHFSAIDVERVARELDVAVLQENITSVAFCNLDSERCPHCQNPMDPVLLKVFKLAQLTIEYLLHSQDFLTASIQLLEERLQGALDQHEKTKQEVTKQAEELKAVKEESRRRKKMIATQQLLIQAGANNYHKCHFCDKSFMNYSYLQSHVQRRHPEVTDAERQRKKQAQRMEDELEDLRERLKLTRSQLEAEREADALQRTQEAEAARRREEEGKKEFENWKEEERKKFYQEMDSLRLLFTQEFKEIANKNSSIETKLKELQMSGVTTSNLGMLRDEDEQGEREQTEQELKALWERSRKQKTEWKKKMRELQRDYMVEKEELKQENERLRAALSQDQRDATDKFQQQILSLSSKVKEQNKVIRLQDEKIRKLSSKNVQEMKDTLDRKQKLLEALRRNPNFVQQFQPILEELLEEKLESMGLRKDTKGIPSQTYKSLQAALDTQRELKAKKFLELMSLRKKFAQEVTRRVKQTQKSQSNAIPTTSPTSVKSLRKDWSQYATPKPKKSQVITSHPVQSTAPKPVPRTRVPVPTSTSYSAVPRASTPPFSSEEETIEDSAYVTSPRAKDTPHIRVIQSMPKEEAPAVSEDDWSESDYSMEEVSPCTRASPVKSPQGTMVQHMAKNLERQLSVQGKKPVGGIKIHTPQITTPSNSRNAAKRSQLSDEESDLEISSIEEITDAVTPMDNRPKAAARQSTDSVGSQGTSVWSSSSGSRPGEAQVVFVLFQHSSRLQCLVVVFWTLRLFLLSLLQLVHQNPPFTCPLKLVLGKSVSRTERSWYRQFPEKQHFNYRYRTE